MINITRVALSHEASEQHMKNNIASEPHRTMVVSALPGTVIPKEKEILCRWKKHFEELLSSYDCRLKKVQDKARKVSHFKSDNDIRLDMLKTLNGKKIFL